MSHATRLAPLWLVLCTLLNSLVGCTPRPSLSIVGTWGVCSFLEEDEHTMIFGTRIACKETVRFLDDGTFLIYPANTIRFEQAGAQTRGTYRVLSVEPLAGIDTTGELQLTLTAPVSITVRVPYTHVAYERLSPQSHNLLLVTAESEHLPCQSCRLYQFYKPALPDE